MRLPQPCSSSRGLLLLPQQRVLVYPLLLGSVILQLQLVGGFRVSLPTKCAYQRTRRIVDSSRLSLLLSSRLADEAGTASIQDPTLLSTGAVKFGNDVAAHSFALGNLSRIELEESHSSLLEAMGIPTFACSGGGALDSQDEGDTCYRSERASANVTWSDITSSGDDCNEQYGPAFTISAVLSNEVCQDIIDSCETAISTIESMQSTTTSMNRDHPSTPDSMIKNHHGAMQLIVSQETANTIADRIAPLIPLNQVEQRRAELDAAQNSTLESSLPSTAPSSELWYVGLNRRFRIYKYAPNAMDRFAPHIDAGFPPSGVRTTSVQRDPSTNATSVVNTTSLVFDDTETVVSTLNRQMFGPSSPFYIRNVVSRLTVLFYLNDGFAGGETNFYQPQKQKLTNDSIDRLTTPIASVRPNTGSCLIFPQCVGAEVMDSYARKHWPMHEGSPVMAGSRQSKYVIRSDLLFAEVCRS